MTAAIWCPKDAPTANSKSRVYRMYDVIDDTGINALQLYAQNFKQADSTLSGTVRKASQISQSTKATNSSATVSAAAVPNRRASTTTTQHRGSVSIVKQEDAANGVPSEAVPEMRAVEITKRCITCDADTSPKWWSYPELMSQSSISGTSIGQKELHSVNGTTSQYPLREVPQDRALASAAFNEISKPADDTTTEFQCHKCHHNKVLKKPPTPPPAAPIPATLPISGVIANAHLNPVPHSVSAVAPLASPATLTSPAAREQQAPPRYQPWGPTPAYSPPAPPQYVSAWARQSPGPVQTQIPQYNSSQSPYANPVPSYNMQQAPPRPSSSLAQSPRLNGIISPITNGYQHQQHHPVNGSHMPANTQYPSYTSHMPSPHLLTNGGPPPRPGNHAFGQVPQNQVHRPSPYGPHHSSPPSGREMPLRDPRDIRDPPSHNRANGGASASPSINSLLN